MMQQLWRISLLMHGLVGGLLLVAMYQRNYDLRGEHTTLILLLFTLVLTILAVVGLVKSYRSRRSKFLLSLLQGPGLFGVIFLLLALLGSGAFGTTRMISLNAPSLINGITIRHTCFLHCRTTVYHDRWFWSREISAASGDGVTCEPELVQAKWTADETRVDVRGCGVDRSFPLAP